MKTLSTIWITRIWQFEKKKKKKIHIGWQSPTHTNMCFAPFCNQPSPSQSNPILVSYQIGGQLPSYNLNSPPTIMLTIDYRSFAENIMHIFTWKGVSKSCYFFHQLGHYMKVCLVYIQWYTKQNGPWSCPLETGAFVGMHAMGHVHVEMEPI